MMFFGKSEPPPPPPPLIDIDNPLIVLTAITTAVAVLMVMWIMLGGSKKLVAVCELTVNGKAGDDAASKKPVLSPQKSLKGPVAIAQGLASQFVPERAFKVSGCVKLVQSGGMTSIEYHIVGLTPGQYVFHIHETQSACSSIHTLPPASISRLACHSLASHSRAQTTSWPMRRVWPRA